MIKARILGLVLTAAAMVTACASPPTARDPEATVPLKRVDEIPKTLAILPFENNSVTDAERFEPLSRGLAAMLITDLQQSGTTVKIIERERIQALLKEIALGQSGVLDQETAVEVGRILGAQTIAFGSFMVLMDQVRIDVRIVKVETSEMLMADSITGRSGEFIGLQQDLARRIGRSLRIPLEAPAAGAGGGDIGAALYFSRGLDALDRGDKAEARRLFDQAVALDPGYRSQVANLKGL
jgi:TolB-like protein